uniref:Secreted protein n=1 Tax=Micrurus lemniscatus lemniscatus TaxID=129467 RepID=A0A2D4IWF1_MICLE
MNSAGWVSLLMAPLLLKAKISSASASGAQTLGRLLFYCLLMRSCHSEHSCVISNSLQRASKDQSAYSLSFYTMVIISAHLQSYLQSTITHSGSPISMFPFQLLSFPYLAATDRFQLLTITKPGVSVKNHNGHKSRHPT